MTTFVIIFNILCVSWCCGLGVFVLIKRHQNKKKALKKFEEEKKDEQVSCNKNVEK